MELFSWAVSGCRRPGRASASGPSAARAPGGRPSFSRTPGRAPAARRPSSPAGGTRSPAGSGRRCACIFFRCRVLPYGVGHRRRSGCCFGRSLGQPGRYGSGFLVQPGAVRRARALWLVARARRSDAKPVHCLRVASSAAANRDHRATTNPRTTRRGRPGSLHPSLYRLSRRARESNRTGLPKHTSLNALRGLASRRAAARVGAKEAARELVGATRRPRRGSGPRKNRREPPAPITQGALSKRPTVKWTSPS